MAAIELRFSVMVLEVENNKAFPLDLSFHKSKTCMQKTHSRSGKIMETWQSPQNPAFQMHVARPNQG